MFSKILLPLDGSVYSERIGSWVTGLAEALDAEVALSSVVDERDIAAFGGNADAAKNARDSASKYLANRAEALDARGIKVSTHVAEGDPAEQIIKLARSVKADMLAMATRRESALARGILGSTTDQVLHSSPLPMLVINPRNAGDLVSNSDIPKTVIVPLDGSSLAEQPVPAALRIASACGARIIFVRAIQIAIYGPWYASGGYIEPEATTTLDETSRREDAVTYLAPFVEMARSEDIDAEARVETGSPVRCITEVTDASPSPLVIMSTRGASGLKRWVVGSKTDKLVRSLAHPVLVFPPVVESTWER